MRIIFICGCLEPGRDGVGDYTMRLSLDLVRMGHQVAVASINDHYVKEVKDGLYQDTGLDIPILRLPSSLKEKAELELLQNWIEKFNPDWLSLQYVPFSFDPRGLIFGLAKRLKTVGRGVKWHFMLHELWVGMDAESSQKEFFWGKAQRYLAGALHKKLKPSVVHTHTELYKKQLEGLGIQVNLLPLFSNIPVVDAEKVNQKLEKKIQAEHTIEIVIFGGIHAGAPIQQLASEAKAYGTARGIKLKLVIVGRSGAEQLHWVKEWEAAGLEIEQLGEQSAERVSEILAQARFGIFTTPIALVEKSGSVAAMREHGIHLLCVSRPWNPRSVKLELNPYHIMQYEEGKLDEFLGISPDFSYMPTLPKVAEQFISNLLNVN